MNLNGKLRVGIEQLEEERKTWLRMMPAEESCSFCANQFRERFAGERAVTDDALIFAVIDDLPTLGIVAMRADGLAEDLFESAAAPEVTTKEGLETEWIELRHLGEAFRGWEGFAATMLDVSVVRGRFQSGRVGFDGWDNAGWRG
jgi:hypothetical protein